MPVVGALLLSAVDRDPGAVHVQHHPVASFGVAVGVRFGAALAGVRVGFLVGVELAALVGVEADACVFVGSADYRG